LKENFLSMKESKRALILQDVKSGVINLKKVSVLLQLSYPQTKRIWRNFKMEGPKGLISKKRGKKSNRAVPDERRKEIVRVIRDNDLGCRPLFISEKLRERQNLKQGENSIKDVRRREREGELVQMDASDHKWFEDRGPKCHLHLLVDDATSKIYGGYFTKEQTTEGYFRACFPYFERKGLPLSFYHDLSPLHVCTRENKIAPASPPLGIPKNPRKTAVQLKWRLIRYLFHTGTTDCLKICKGVKLPLPYPNIPGIFS